MPEPAMDFIVAAFAAGENLIVAGDHNAGKTTFLRAVCLRGDPAASAGGDGGGVHHRARFASRRPAAEHGGAVFAAAVGGG